MCSTLTDEVELALQKMQRAEVKVTSAGLRSTQSNAWLWPYDRTTRSSARMFVPSSPSPKKVRNRAARDTRAARSPPASIADIDSSQVTTRDHASNGSRIDAQSARGITMLEERRQRGDDVLDPVPAGIIRAVLTRHFGAERAEFPKKSGVRVRRIAHGRLASLDDGPEASDVVGEGHRRNALDYVLSEVTNIDAHPGASDELHEHRSSLHDPVGVT